MPALKATAYPSPARRDRPNRSCYHLMSLLGLTWVPTTIEHPLSAVPTTAPAPLDTPERPIGCGLGRHHGTGHREGSPPSLQAKALSSAQPLPRRLQAVYLSTRPTPRAVLLGRSRGGASHNGNALGDGSALRAIGSGICAPYGPMTRRAHETRARLAAAWQARSGAVHGYADVHASVSI